jgi:hypothetical protein
MRFSRRIDSLLKRESQWQPRTWPKVLATERTGEILAIPTMNLRGLNIAPGLWNG